MYEIDSGRAMAPHPVERGRSLSAPAPIQRRTWLMGMASGCATLMLSAPSAVALPLLPGFYGNFAGMRLKDQNGQTLAVRSLLGKIVLVNFVFTGCSTVCPVQTRALVEVQRQLPPEVRPRTRLLSLSLDPLNDTPEALKRFAQRMEADVAGWTFASGRPQDIERIAEALKLYRQGVGARKPDDHSTALWLVDARGDLRMRYSGNPPEVGRLVREITALDRLSRSVAAPV